MAEPIPKSFNIIKYNSSNISFYNNKWYISFQLEIESEHNITNNNSIGIDLGVKKLATLSNGNQIIPINSMKNKQHKMAKLQQQLAKKIKYSNNYKKQKRKINKLHAKIKNIRMTQNHKITTTLTNQFNTVFIEDLKTKNMTKSAKGDINNPGKNVNAKSGLNKAILDQGWFQFKQQLIYKSIWKNGKIVMVDPKYTSQTCSKCNHTHKNNRKSQTSFICEQCNYSINADINAAINIKNKGLLLITK